MFKKTETINSREFRIIQKKGKKIFSPFFRVILFGESFKIAVVVSKKIYKKRVDRNTQKRRIMHALKDVAHVPQKNIVIFLQKDISQISLVELTKLLGSVLKKY